MTLEIFFAVNIAFVAGYILGILIERWRVRYNTERSGSYAITVVNPSAYEPGDVIDAAGSELVVLSIDGCTLIVRRLYR